MNNIYFRDFEEFKSIFPIRVVRTNNDGSEVKQRKNNIFLQAYKFACKNNHHKQFEMMFPYVSLDVIYSNSLHFLSKQFRNNNVILSGVGNFYIPEVYTDSLLGICVDGDVKSVRYCKISTDGDGNSVEKIYKMKAGKFMRLIIEQTDLKNIIGDIGIVYLCEVFSQKWSSFVASQMPDFKLCVSKDADDFEYIYSSENQYDSDFGSCMVDDGLHYFYSDSVDASAVWLTRIEDGKMMARAIIYNKCKDVNTGKIYRLLERQYSASDLYRNILVDKCIAEGIIDGFKKIGSGCGDCRAFVGIDGADLSECKFTIACNLKDGDIVSYQDSFKWFDYNNQLADNFGDGDVSLDITSGTVEIHGCNYDDLNNEWTNDDLVLVLYCGSYSYCETYTSEYFAEINLDYSNRFNMYICGGVYSDLLDDYLPPSLVDELEDEYKEDNWNYDEYNDEYTPDGLITVVVTKNGEFIELQVSEDYANDNFFFVDDSYFESVSVYSDYVLNLVV